LSEITGSYRTALKAVRILRGQTHGWNAREVLNGKERGFTEGLEASGLSSKLKRREGLARAKNLKKETRPGKEEGCMR